ncbi:MAG: hypothetical protein BWY26_00068 [Elusimicrobia bacterium ADurb.Bin231]|nr:MAG: hypothetical protein BWY26_00068 [Elusimicrobia bacterium ADurb.Bin231]
MLISFLKSLYFNVLYVYSFLNSFVHPGWPLLLAYRAYSILPNEYILPFNPYPLLSYAIPPTPSSICQLLRKFGTFSVDTLYIVPPKFDNSLNCGIYAVLSGLLLLSNHITRMPVDITILYSMPVPALTPVYALNIVPVDKLPATSLYTKVFLYWVFGFNPVSSNIRLPHVIPLSYEYGVSSTPLAPAVTSTAVHVKLLSLFATPFPCGGFGLNEPLSNLYVNSTLLPQLPASSFAFILK